MLLVTVVIISLQTVKISASTINLTCDYSASKPSDDILKQMHNIWLGTDIGLDSTFDLVPPIYKTRYKDIDINSKSVFRKIIYGGRKCRTKLRRTSGDLMDISLCPWYVEMSYDTDRFPERIASAICKCKHCYSFKGEQIGRSRHSNIPKCKEIKQMIKVLRVQKNNNVPVCQPNNNKLYLYKNSYEEITIGCTCALKEDKRSRIRKTKTES